MNTRPKSVEAVAKGDLVFLRTAGSITHVSIALGPVVNGSIEILDASSDAGKVSKRSQKIGAHVEIGTPYFYA